MRVSIVINTLNRAPFLKRALQSLRYLDYPTFEVIVVNGPSEDDTNLVLQEYQPFIKIGYCPQKNLSISRNIGIAMAEGEIVAFIDDDAVPEPEWLRHIVEGYDSAQIAGVGGPVYDHTGYRFQFQYVLGDRIEGHHVASSNPGDAFCFPGSFEFVSMAGTNATFRRSALLQVGGFDEQYDYGWDEVDVCARLIDAGYIIRNVDAAYIHHKYAPSHLRTAEINTNYYPIMKNLIYFMEKNYLPFYSDTGKVLDRLKAHTFLKQEAEENYKQKKLTEGEYQFAINSIYRGLKQGFLDAVEQRKLIGQQTLVQHKTEYFPFQWPSTIKQRLVICLINPNDLTNESVLSAGTRLVATQLAALLHHVHVIAKSSSDINSVDYQQGVWIHEIGEANDANQEIVSQDLLLDLQNISAIHKEIRRILQHHGEIDFVVISRHHLDVFPTFLKDEYFQNKLITFDNLKEVIKEYLQN